MSIVSCVRYTEGSMNGWKAAGEGEGEGEEEESGDDDDKGVSKREGTCAC